jgi:hypothetical protein
MPHRHGLVREGIYSGAVGATVIAVWFLIVDTVAGHPFYTPRVLGRGLISILGMATMPDTAMTEVLGYTLVHYVAFAIAGIIVVAVVHQADRTPGILAGLLVMFVMFMVGFYGAAAFLSESPLGGLAWYQIFIANLLASASMGWFIWKRHPRLTAQINTALEGRDA